MKLEGTAAIVTGGASGFGAGIVRKFVEQGARVLIADLNGKAARTLAEDLGQTVVAHATNVADDTSVAGMLQAAKSAFGGVDILVNNAGVTHQPAAMEDVTEEDFDFVFRVNCKSVYLTSKHIVPVMKSQGHGAILNVASTAGVSPRPRLNWYNASKGWMNTAT